MSIPESVIVSGVTFTVKRNGAGTVKLIHSALTITVHVREVAVTDAWQRDTEAFNAEMLRAFNQAKSKAIKAVAMARANAEKENTGAKK